jgi:hypothetical protein
VVGDWNGDGVTTVGVVCAASPFASWYLRNENSPGGPDQTNGVPFAFGMANWIPIAGDWTGSGHTGIGMFDPATGTWYLENNAGSGKLDFQFQFGAPGWIPIVGDWNHSGHAGIGVIDPGTTTGYMTWYLRDEASPGSADAGIFAYGLSSWKPVVGDWNGDGKTTIGVVDTTGIFSIYPVWYLRNENSPGGPDAGQFVYGANSWVPVAGTWSAPVSNAALVDSGPATQNAGMPDTLSTAVPDDLLAAMLVGRPQHSLSVVDEAFASLS